jgi:hypothetical protein
MRLEEPYQLALLESDVMFCVVGRSQSEAQYVPYDSVSRLEEPYQLALLESDVMFCVVGVEHSMYEAFTRL